MDTENITYMDVKLEDLTYFWTKSGVPCFMANRDNIEEEIEFLGFNIYYLICNVAEHRKVEHKAKTNPYVAPWTETVTDYSTNIVKVVNNFVGRSVAIVEDEDIYDFEAVRVEAEYSLPPIPRVMIDKLDEFFRLVDTQHGTESIVMLTFDPNFEGSSEGWGVLVPEQTNTSVHCKYEADSIVDQKPDHVLIVGTVHSHPKMAAYASGTDHADQADFDGIHITFGWQSAVNNGATQYHIELQMAGTAYTLKPEDVFESFTITKDADPEVVAWTDKVKKVLPPIAGGSVTQVAQHTAQRQVPQHQGYTPAGTIKGDSRLQELPELKDVDPYVIIAEVDYAEKDAECPSCAHPFILVELLDCVCPNCDILICDLQSSYSEILMSASRYLRERKKDPNMNYYLWVKNDNGEDMLMRIADKSDDYVPTLITDSQVQIEELDNFYYQGFDEGFTVCCNIPVEDAYKCICTKTVLYSDVMDFDQAHPYDVYDRNSTCLDCEYYYSKSCEPYFNSILEFASTKKPIETAIKECKDFTAFSNFAYERSSYYE
jgi:hypothetical protein